jgi:hypothetical protein
MLNVLDEFTHEMRAHALAGVETWAKLTFGSAGSIRATPWGRGVKSTPGP